ncbi:hypothetical protein KY358_03550 [Candidatus Woesearchaeota archaeon]|nr:hypothetical protein [Candidatus Woesearchaeota archaeon]
MSDAGGLFEGDEEKDSGKTSDDTLEIKIRFNKFWLERIAYIFIIIVLIVLVLYNPLGRYRCEKGLDMITSEKITSEGTKATEPVIEEDPVIEEEPKIEMEEEHEDEIEPETEEELSGDAILNIDNIELDVNKTRVEVITVKIDNQYKIFTPLLYVYWYDKDSSNAMKNFPNGGKINFTGPIPTRRVSVKKLDDELKSHYLRTDDETKEFFKIELYDLSDKTLLDTKTKSIATD